MEETATVKPAMNDEQYYRKLASEISYDEVQREILAQLYLNNDRLKSIKSYVGFFVILTLLSVLLAALMLEK